MRLLCTFLLIAATALPLQAQVDSEGAAHFRLGGDSYAAGRQVIHDAAGLDNVFLAGESVNVAAPISGTAHLAGRRVGIDAELGGNLYAAGMDVEARAPVSGDATLAGYTVRVSESIGGNLRVTGSRVTVLAPVSGAALLAGETIRLDSTIAGDAAIAGENIRFGPAARIEGNLRVYSENPDALEIPASVIPPERVSRLDRAEWEGIETRIPRPSWWKIIGSFLGGVIVVAAIAALVAAVAPAAMADMRSRLLERPFGTLGWGFLALSAVIGSAIVTAMTLVGIFLSPAALALAALAGFSGYVIGAYSFGAGLLAAFGHGTPEALGGRVLAALVGASLAALLAVIPVIGWLFVLALSLAGLGALVLRLLRPRFFAT